MTDSHQSDVLITAIKRRHVQAVLTDLQVATTVDHLGPEFTDRHRQSTFEPTPVPSLLLQGHRVKKNECTYGNY